MLFALLAAVLQLGVACTPKTEVAPPVQPVAVAEEESVDTACSYAYYLWGKTAENNDRYDEALEMYEKVLFCDSNSSYVMRDLAFLLIKMGRNQEGIVWLEKIIENDPADIDTRSILARLYAGMGKVNEAVQIYNTILAIRQDPQTLLMLGRLYARNRQYEQAQDVLTRLVEQDNESYMGHYYLAQLYRELHFTDKAIAAYEKALQLNWSARLALELAELFELDKRDDRAAELYRRIIDEEPMDEQAWLRLVNLYLSLKKTDEALAVLKEYKQLSGDSRKIDFMISRLLMAMGSYQEAIDSLNGMIDEYPDLVASRYMLALAYYQNGDPQAARSTLNEIPVDAHEFENSVLLRVKIFQDEENSTAAINLLQSMLSDPATSKMQFYPVLASLYHEEKRTAEAKRLMADALADYSSNVDFIFEYGLLLERMGDQTTAMKMMEDVLAIEPHHSAALNYIGYSWADQGVNLDQARKYIEEAASLNPEDGYIRDSLGWVYFKLGDLERARLELEKSIQLVESDPVIFEHLGDVYHHGGQHDKAREMYEKALAITKDDSRKEVLQQKLNAISGGI